MKYAVANKNEIEPGQMKDVEIGKRSILLIRNLEGEFLAIKNVCPHQGVKLSSGSLGGTLASGEIGEYKLERKGEIVRCPWHSWEFDARTGCSLVDPDSFCVSAYQTSVEGNTVYVCTNKINPN